MKSKALMKNISNQYWMIQKMHLEYMIKRMTNLARNKKTQNNKRLTILKRFRRMKARFT